MDQAVAVVRDKHHIPQSMTNQVVADELLRARIRSGGGCNDDVPSIANSRRDVVPSSGVLNVGDRGHPEPYCAQKGVPNVGSRGHPEFCCRPCRYAARGYCAMGIDCRFCHLPHPKRPVRFDRAHRNLLKSMPFDDFIALLAPILKQKLKGIDLGSPLTNLLDILWRSLDEHGHAEDEGGSCDSLSDVGMCRKGIFTSEALDALEDATIAEAPGTTAAGTHVVGITN